MKKKSHSEITDSASTPSDTAPASDNETGKTSKETLASTTSDAAIAKPGDPGLNVPGSTPAAVAPHGDGNDPATKNAMGGEEPPNASGHECKAENHEPTSGDANSGAHPTIEREQSVDRIVGWGGGQLPPVRIATGAGDDPPPDPFDPARLQLPQSFDAMLAIKKVLLTVPVRKPANEWFIQTHPDQNYRLATAVLELKEDREIYLVDPDLWSALSSESLFSPRAIFTAISRQGVVFLWPIRLPGPDGKIDPWNKSALEAAAMATGQWVRVQSNKELGAYDVFPAPANLPQPEWPNHKFQDLLRTAFKDHHITTLDHPVLRRLRGEV